MKQYDKIWVPIPHIEALNDCEARTIGAGYYKPLLKSVTITLEELKELWDAGVHKGWEETRPTDEDEATDFKTYLQSKGVNI